MLRTLVAVAALSQVVSQVDAQDLLVRTVDLRGDPVSGIPVKIGDIESQSDANGLARFENDEPLPPGSFRIQVNLKADFPSDRINPSYIGRVKYISWHNEDQFAGGFVIPLWELGDVKSLGTAVVRNPGHYAVVLQYDENEVSSTRVVAKSEGDADAWIEKWVPDLPAVDSPSLATSLHAAVQPGEMVPPQFAGEMAEVYREVEQWKQTSNAQHNNSANSGNYTIASSAGGSGVSPMHRAPEDPNRQPPGPPEPNGRTVTTCKPVWETEYREERRVVRRAVVETQMREERRVVQKPVTSTVVTCQVQTTLRPVTVYRQQVVDQGQFVDQWSFTPGRTRNRLQWLPRQTYQNTQTGVIAAQRPGLYWVPQANANGTYQVQRMYVPNPVVQQVPTTQMVPVQVVQKVPVQVTQYQSEVQVRQVPVQVTRYVDEVQTRRVPVQVCKMVCATKTIQVPRTPTETSYRQVPNRHVVYDDTGWVSVNGRH